MKALSLFIAALSLSSVAFASPLNFGDSKYAAYKAVLNSADVEWQISTLNQQGFNLQSIDPVGSEAEKSLPENFEVLLTKEDKGSGRLVACRFNVVVGQAFSRSNRIKSEVKDIQPIERMQCQ